MLPVYHALTPASLNEAVQTLAQRQDLIPIAGGTNVVIAMRDGEHQGKTLMDLSRLKELRGIQIEDGYLRLGGGTTLREVLESAELAEYAVPLHQAAQNFANPLVRNRATVAGNIVDSSPAADTAPALLVLDAVLELTSISGTRQLPVDDFLVGPNQTAIRPDELLTSILLPLPSAGSRGGFYKLALRRGTACSVISAAVQLEFDPAGHVSKARIALGAVAERPIRTYAAEEALLGAPLAPANIEKAAAIAAKTVRPIDDVRSTADYRRRMAGALVRRLLNQLLDEMEAN